MRFPTVYNTISIILRIMTIKHEIGNEDCGVPTGNFCALESGQYFSYDLPKGTCNGIHLTIQSEGSSTIHLAVYSSHLATGIRCLSQLWPCQSADGQITTIGTVSWILPGTADLLLQSCLLCCFMLPHCSAWVQARIIVWSGQNCCNHNGLAKKMLNCS